MFDISDFSRVKKVFRVDSIPNKNDSKLVEYVTHTLRPEFWKTLNSKKEKESEFIYGMNNKIFSSSSSKFILFHL